MSTLSAAALAKKLEISTATLRNWEKGFAEWLSADYKEGRSYTKVGVQQFIAIKHLLHERGFTVEGAKKELQRYNNLEGQQVEVISKLRQLRSFLEELKTQI